MKQAHKAVISPSSTPPEKWCAAHLYLLFTHEQRVEKEEKTIGIFFEKLIFNKIKY
ncbi:hypothetical protein HF330_09645 [Bacillus pumilus]|nr:hypothetical protein [Bacillus pumilus]